MHCNIWHDKNLCGTNLCDRRLTRINKSHAEICRFTVTTHTIIDCLSTPESIHFLAKRTMDIKLARIQTVHVLI